MSFILRRIINVISTDMKMMVLEPGLQGGGEDLGVGGCLEKAHSVYGTVHPEEQGWMHSWQALKPHLPSAVKGKKIEHDSRAKKRSAIPVCSRDVESLMQLFPVLSFNLQLPHSTPYLRYIVCPPQCLFFPDILKVLYKGD